MISNTVFDILPQELNLRLIDLKQNQFLCSQAKECGQSST